MSWAGKILRVNLTAGTVKSEPLNMEWAQAYIGSRGLGTKYLVEEVDATVDPLSPDNKIIWATGPLTGTMASTGGRYTVITKGPLTGAIACSNSGGYWGAEFKMAGWDMVIFEGKSAKPVYLYVNDDVAELRDAAHLWGKSVWETEEMIKKGLQDPLARVSSIGKAGENGVLFAAVVNDLHRAAGRSGVGAVMGSKNLKAIAVRGTKGVGNIRDPKAFMAATKAAKKVLAENGVTGTGLPAMGTQVLMSVINEVGALPTRNHRDNQFEGAKDIGAEAMATPRKTDGKKHLVTNQACFGCTIACGRISKMDEGHFTIENKPQYRGANGGLEYEAAWALGAANGVNDLECLQYANLLCNEEGIDPISFGATVGAVMELYGMGVLTKEQIGIEANLWLGAGAGLSGRRNRQRPRFWQGNWPGFQTPDRQVWSPGTQHVIARARNSRPTMRVAFRALAWRMPPATGVAATCAATPLRPKFWVSRSRPIRLNPKASPSWSRPSRTPPRRLTRRACASSPPLPGACKTCRPKCRARVASSTRLKNWPRLVSASGTWSASSTTVPASPKPTTACRRADQRGGCLQNRPGQRQVQRTRHHAAAVLRSAWLGS